MKVSEAQALLSACDPNAELVFGPKDIRFDIMMEPVLKLVATKAELVEKSGKMRYREMPLSGNINIVAIT